MKFQTIPYHVVQHKDLDAAIKEWYDFDTEVALQEDWNDDSQHTYWVNGQVDWWLYDEIINGRTDYGTAELFLNALCVDAVIPVGWYVVEVQ